MNLSTTNGAVSGRRAAGATLLALLVLAANMTFGAAPASAHFGCRDLDTLVAPTAAFTSTSTGSVPIAGEPVGFDARGSTGGSETHYSLVRDGDGQAETCELYSHEDYTVSSYAWDFDSNGTVDATDAVTSRSFSAGTHTVKLTVSSGSGSDELTRSITVYPRDSDGDGLPDDRDNCPGFPSPDPTDTDGDGSGDACDVDDDGDDRADDLDNCKLIPNADQVNTDDDSYGDACDVDDDNDGRADGEDNCGLTANADQRNADGDGQGDACDADDDNDGRADAADNCALVPNADQANTDSDAEGDACDADDDGDDVSDADDNCRLTANADQANTDGDAEGNACDADDDNDGQPDDQDGCPTGPFCEGDEDNDGMPDDWEPRFGTDPADQDSDDDGRIDGMDNCPADANPDQADTAGERWGDACESRYVDSDGDQWFDFNDNCPDLRNGGLDGQPDGDGDGVGDDCDADFDGDGDGRPELNDNCAGTPNASQTDLDGDGHGDECDQDVDGDGRPNAGFCAPPEDAGPEAPEVCEPADNCRTVANADQKDLDRDGRGDACDGDDDGDNVADASDNCPLGANPSQADADNDGRGDACDASVTPPANTPPKLALSVPKQKLRTVLSKGLYVHGTCNEACSVAVRVVLPGASAKRLGLSRGKAVVVGKTTRSLKAGTKTKMVVKLTTKAKRAFAKLRSVRLTLKATPRDTAKLAGTSKSATITLKR